MSDLPRSLLHRAYAFHRDCARTDTLHDDFIASTAICFLGFRAAVAPQRPHKLAEDRERPLR